MKSKYHFKFEDLIVYQRAMDFGDRIDLQIDTFPKKEMFRLSSQFIRAADSIAFNISEGSGSTDANFNRYLKMAWDSSHECVAASSKARRRGYINFETDEENRRQLTEIGKMISGLRKRL
ncbi:four helix bundle protein [Dokdonia sinensis]|uniref:Four helix bundle protein n=1 Tax=Dokdonia sinensis TaxID=2479847 RepID=A0A3M0FYA8_9FLAO|nr:four helix bundle protein [Dokdonia sinensis]RMB57691.1 four helix bundle protein [Dokdonia sinensis]